jgi:hypothetical protein
LNTPFITERHQPEEASARRTANFILFFATLLLAVVAIVWLRSMPTSLVFIAGSVWICIINYLKLRLPDTLQGVVARQKPLVEKIFSAPRVRKGSRCLVVIDKNDEIFAGARELNRLIFVRLKTGNPWLPQFIVLLIILVFIINIGMMLSAAAESFSGSLSFIATWISALLFIPALLLLFRIIPFFYLILTFIFAAFSIFVVRPLLTVGLGAHALHVEVRFSEIPAADAGARVERFGAEIVSLTPAPKLRFFSNMHFSSFAEFFLDWIVAKGMYGELLSLARQIRNTAGAKQHKKVYYNEAVLTKIASWL